MNDLDTSTRELLDHGAAELWRDGALVGHLSASLEQGWGLGRPTTAQTFVWFLVSPNDATPYVIEDYPPYETLPDAVSGRLEPEDPGPGLYEVRWLHGAEREVAWQRFGIHEPIGTYRLEGCGEPVDWWLSRLIDRIRGRRS